MTETREQTPLRWPEGWRRTLINDRLKRLAWKKPWAHYIAALERELKRTSVTSATITRNDPGRERIDPGVALWFSLKPADDFSWQSALNLDNPAPTLAEIEDAYRRLAQKHHPDRGGDIEMFKRLGEYRNKARSWVLGTNELQMDNCIPCDKFIDARQNLAAVVLALKAFRQLERVGIPAILERVMNTAFKTALPAPESVISGGQQ